MHLGFLIACGVSLLGLACNAQQKTPQTATNKAKVDPKVVPAQPPLEHAAVAPANRQLQPLQPPRKSVPAAPTTFDLKSIQQHVQALDVEPSKEVWSKISWVDNVDEAKRLSAKNNRPIFFFSMHGKLDGRC